MHALVASFTAESISQKVIHVIEIVFQAALPLSTGTLISSMNPPGNQLADFFLFFVRF